VEPWVVISLALGVGLAAAAAVAVRRTRALTRAQAVVARQQAETDRRDAADALAAAELGDLVDVLGSGVVAVDPTLRITMASGVAHALLGRAPGTLVGRSVLEAFLDGTVESVARTALDTGSAASELRPADRDGPALLIRVRRTASGGLWLVMDDVSELRRLQRIRAEFIDNLSHELRTPLSTVSLLSETLSREADAAAGAIPPKMRERIAKIEVETGHLVQMVNEILDLSRIESGSTIELVEELDIGRLAADSAERLRLFAERQGVSLRVEIEPRLPAVRGDEARLGQVVVNLVHNAVKFSPDGGEVVVRARAAKGEVVTSVQDHGVGVPKIAQTRVFERFYKVDRARLRAEAGGGTGLGLAIARHVVEQHGGRIWLESVEGAGSTFSFALPIPVKPGG
jgi:two-component system phosphate regulon sensor histidine kinase PhoR